MSKPNSSDEARAAGRGGIAVLGAKVFFILSGLVQQTILPRLITPAGYGALSRVMAAANIINNVVVNASIQGVSHSVVQTPAEQAPQTLRRVFKAHLAIALPLALVFFFFAPVYAIHFQHAPHIVRPLQIVSVVVLMYGLYAPLVGYLNGLRKFTRQAALDVTYATLRTAGLLGLGWLFARSNNGVTGACIGFAVASCLIFPVALQFTGTGKQGNAGPTVSQHLLFIAPVALGQIAINLLLQSDIAMLGYFASKLTESQGLAQELAQQSADEMVGAYRASQLFAFLPYQLLTSITFILFPMLAKAKADGDTDAIARYVRSGIRLALVFASIMVATVAGLGPHLVRLAYPAIFADMAGDAVRVLALGQGAFAIFYVETIVLNGLGKEGLSAIFNWIAVALIIGLCAALGLQATTGPQLLLFVATATTIALAIAALVGAIAVFRVSGAYTSPLTLLRVVGTLALVVVLGTRLPWIDKKMVLVMAAGLAVAATTILLVTREIGRKDLDLVLTVVRKRKG